ncbi:hypothetical protein [Amycolatopsis echigonensis]|uniref:Uncharacterized protein n=1 Tax=Amycolatopsis echigonensis TaxID=2576905 RepID=A0A8E1W4N9_9PSEU|nr:hypothetical protein [Amycolatopsis echigonensis]MBB2503872.1 hypothetical protein [Amycolatopsis echigonensis]
MPPGNGTVVATRPVAVSSNASRSGSRTPTATRWVTPSATMPSRGAPTGMTSPAGAAVTGAGAGFAGGQREHRDGGQARPDHAAQAVTGPEAGRQRKGGLDGEVDREQSEGDADQAQRAIPA